MARVVRTASRQTYRTGGGGSGTPGAPGAPGAPGSNGWSQTFQTFDDTSVTPSRVLLQFAGWIGGTGDAPSTPTIGQFLGDTGYVDTAALARDIRGPAGSGNGGGGTGDNGWSPILAPEVDGQRVVLRILSWTGGSGTAPAAGGYLGDSGVVSTPAAARDIRGIQGEKGDKGDTGDPGAPGSPGDPGDAGDPGDNGWSAIYNIAADGDRRVEQLAAWVGGTGTPPSSPAVGSYKGSSGHVATPGAAVDVRGPRGLQGDPGAPGEQGDPGAPGAPGDPGDRGDDGDNGWSAVYDIVNDGQRRVEQLASWVGGTGTAPTNPAVGSYKGSSGHVTDIAQAVDVRGPQGEQGDPGSPGDPGDPGAPGAGLPAGGTAGQIPSKIDATDFNVQWINAPTGGGGALPPGGTENQFLRKNSATDGDAGWADLGNVDQWEYRTPINRVFNVPAGLPDFGNTQPATYLDHFELEDGETIFVLVEFRISSGSDLRRGQYGTLITRSGTNYSTEDWTEISQFNSSNTSTAGNAGGLPQVRWNTNIFLPLTNGAPAGAAGLPGVQFAGGTTGTAIDAWASIQIKSLTRSRTVGGDGSIAGPQGPQGNPGADGTNGTDGVGLPAGGTAGQIPSKIDATDFNVQWIDPPSGGGGGTDDQTAAEVPFDTTGNDITGTNVQTAVVEVEGRTPPPGGTVNQLLAKNSGGDYDYTWVDPADNVDHGIFRATNTITANRAILNSELEELFIVTGGTSVELTLPPVTNADIGMHIGYSNQATDGSSSFLEGSGTDRVAGEVSGLYTILPGQSGIIVYRGEGLWQNIADGHTQVVPNWGVSATASPGTPVNTDGAWNSTYANSVVQGGGLVNLVNITRAGTASGTGIRILPTLAGGIGVNVFDDQTQTIEGQPDPTTVSPDLAVPFGMEAILLKRNPTSTEWLLYYFGPARPLVPSGTLPRPNTVWAGLEGAINQQEITETLERFGFERDPAGLLAEATSAGTFVDLSDNVRISERNVEELVIPAVGDLSPQSFTLTGRDETQQTVTLHDGTGNLLRFSDLQAGRLDLVASFSVSSFTGFEPELVTLRLRYGTSPEHTFDFSLAGHTFESGAVPLSFELPEIPGGYASALNDTPVVELIVNERGASFAGSVGVMGLRNTVKGRLYDTVVNLAQNAVAVHRAEVNAQIASLQGREGDFEAGVTNNFEAIQPRISPLRQVVDSLPEENEAFFLTSTGSDAFPGIAAMHRVNPGNPTFTATDVAMWVVVPVSFRDQVHSLENLDDNTAGRLEGLTTENAGSDPDLDILASLTFEGRSYAVYRRSNVTVGNTFRVVHNSVRTVVDWPDRIDTLESRVDAADQILDNPILGIDRAVAGVLENDTSVTQDASTVANPTAFNAGLGTGPGAKVLEQSPATSAPVSGITSSNAISASPADARGRKLFVFHDQSIAADASVLTARNGAATQLLAEKKADGTIEAIQFVPATPSGSAPVTVYPAPSNRVSGSGIWQSIALTTLVKGIPAPLANELFFTRNNASTVRPLTVDFRGHANGNLFGLGQVTLAGYGGSSDVSVTFQLDDGSEVATMELAWLASSRQLRLRAVDRVRQGLPTINDVQVVLSYQDTRTTPGLPATTRRVPIAQWGADGSDQVLAVRPSGTRLTGDVGNDPTIILIGNDSEVDTGYHYDALFGNDDAGALEARGDNVSIYDVRDAATIVQPLVVQLEARTALPADGFFSDDHLHGSVLAFGTQVQAQSPSNRAVKIGDLVGSTVRDPHASQDFIVRGYDSVTGNLIVEGQTQEPAPRAATYGPSSAINLSTTLSPETWSDVPLTSTRFTPVNVTHSSGELTILKDGDYRVTAKIFCEMISSGDGGAGSTSRNVSQLRVLTRPSTGSFVEVPASRDVAYHRVAGQADEGGCQFSDILRLSAGDVVKVQARLSWAGHSGNVIQVLPNMSSLSVEFVAGTETAPT